MKKNTRHISFILVFTLILSFVLITIPNQDDEVLASTYGIDIDKIYDESNYESEFEPGKVLVGLNNNNSTNDITDFNINDIFDGLDIENVEVLIPSDSSLPTRANTLNNPIGDIISVSLTDKDRQAVLDAINILKDNPNIAYAEPNYIGGVDAAPNDPEYSNLYGMDKISAPQAWDIFTGSSDIVVGVIDTGIDYTHPDLVNNIWTNPGEIPDNGIDDDGNGYIDDYYGWDFAYNDNDPMDGDGHGTHVAGTIGAMGNNNIGVAGVNWKAKLAAIKWIDDGGYGDTEDAIKAIRYSTTMDMPITNNSWRIFEYSASMEIAIEQCNGLFVTSAGNYSQDNDIIAKYPATYDFDHIISVASTDSTDSLSDFSNYGLVSVDLAAPGTDIYSTVPGKGYEYYSGTSMASPHVAGAAALLMGYNQTLTRVEVKNKILSSVDKVPVLSDKVATGGRLNIYNMLNSEKSQNKTSTLIIGNSASGHTSNDVDFLCDGTNDDEEINAAIQDLPISGGKITILDGTYDIRETIKIDKDNVTIEGMGNSTRLVNNHSDITINLEIISSNNSISNINIANNWYDGSCIGVRGSNNIITENKIYGEDDFAIVVDSSGQNNIISNNICLGEYCDISVSGTNNIITGNICVISGIEVYGNDNVISGNICSSYNYGISLYFCNNITVAGNTVNDSFVGLEISNSNGNTIFGNTFNNNTRGMDLMGSSRNNITGNTIMRGTGLSTDYDSLEHTIRLWGPGNNNNLISNNLILGKNYITDGGIGNTFLDNKY